VKRYTVLALLLLLVTATGQAASEVKRGSLAGIKEFSVLVETLPADAESAGLTRSQIRVGRGATVAKGADPGDRRHAIIRRAIRLHQGRCRCSRDMKGAGCPAPNRPHQRVALNVPKLLALVAREARSGTRGTANFLGFLQVAEPAKAIARLKRPML
jgi:hypothetical protein